MPGISRRKPRVTAGSDSFDGVQRVDSDAKPPTPHLGFADESLSDHPLATSLKSPNSELSSRVPRSSRQAQQPASAMLVQRTADPGVRPTATLPIGFFPTPAPFIPKLAFDRLQLGLLSDLPIIGPIVSGLAEIPSLIGLPGFGDESTASISVVGTTTVPPPPPVESTSEPPPISSSFVSSVIPTSLSISISVFNPLPSSATSRSITGGSFSTSSTGTVTVESSSTSSSFVGTESDVPSLPSPIPINPNAAKISGIVIGVTFVIGIIGLVLFFLRRLRVRRAEADKALRVDFVEAQSIKQLSRVFGSGDSNSGYRNLDSPTARSTFSHSTSSDISSSSAIVSSVVSPLPLRLTTGHLLTIPVPTHASPTSPGNGSNPASPPFANPTTASILSPGTRSSQLEPRHLSVRFADDNPATTSSGTTRGIIATTLETPEATRNPFEDAASVVPFIGHQRDAEETDRLSTESWVDMGFPARPPTVASPFK